jgi:hypothetical protein
VVNAVQTGAQVVSLMYDAAGSDAVYAASTLERCFRDVHVITQHLAGASNRYEQLGASSWAWRWGRADAPGPERGRHGGRVDAGALQRRCR